MECYTSNNEFNCGIDLHTPQLYIVYIGLMDRRGKKLVHANVQNNDFQFFLKLVEPCRHDLTGCCECLFG
jgi:hypothetical protein